MQYISWQTKDRWFSSNTVWSRVMSGNQWKEIKIQIFGNPLIHDYLQIYENHGNLWESGNWNQSIKWPHNWSLNHSSHISKQRRYSIVSKPATNSGKPGRSKFPILHYMQIKWWTVSPAYWRGWSPSAVHPAQAGRFTPTPHLIILVWACSPTLLLCQWPWVCKV